MPAQTPATKQGPEEVPRPKRAEDFSEWYNDVVERAGLTDKRYPIKGMNVWPGHGWAVMRRIDDLIRKYCDSTDPPHQEVCFPLLIPESELAKEAEHIKGFHDQVFWVTRAGANVLDIPLCLRPTSETAMYPIFKEWVRSHADLPLKTYQIVNTFRYETKQTRAFIRVREIHFFEAHTCHADEEDAERQIKEDLEIGEKLSAALALVSFIHKRPDWDKFPGAHYTLGWDTFMESGRALQTMTMHQYRDNFAKAYDVKYEDANGEHRYVHQTTYGISERILGAVVMAHGDDKGISLPPVIAPIQLVIVPILAKGKQDEVLAHCRALSKRWREAGFRVHLDDRDIRPGAKYYDWELKGVPLRAEIGGREMLEKKVTLIRRFDGSKSQVGEDEIAERLPRLFEEITSGMRERFRKTAESSIALLVSLDAFDPKKAEGKMVRMHWCGEMPCAKTIEQALDMPLLGFPLGVESKGPCAACGKESAIVVDAAKSY
ncbi:MAG TPA: proline--tRNA ligase [Thermoplasmata archaeon]|nr:proline--tRNA ligase [Thermoplasmata archaeon]